MVNELHLNGGELFVFALVNQFSQSEAGIYKGGIPYLCQWTGWSQNTIRKYLRNLESAGLIKSIRGDINGVPFCDYQTINVPTLQNLKDTPQNLSLDPSKIEVPTLQNLRGEYNNKNRKENNKNNIFRKPTLQEVSDYCKERNNGIDAEAFIAFYESKGWMVGKSPMKDWKSAIITWEKSRKATPTPNPSPKKEKKEESLVDYYRRIFAEINGTDNGTTTDNPDEQ